MGEREDPFQLVFGPFVPDRFEAMRKSLEQDEVDLFDRDAWTLSRPGVELLHDLRPDGGLGEGVEELVALAHAAFLFWQQEERVVVVNRALLDAVITGARADSGGAGPRSAYYVALAPRRVWGTPVAGAPAEPLEGWFTIADESRLTLVAVFGLLAGRPGFTAVQVSGPPPGELRRDDTTVPFAPVLEGGAAAGLWSVIGGEELCELGWRIHRRVIAAGGLRPGRQEVAA
ncbi:MAG TPA: hypothetical protein VMK53_01895 [Gemmatimonadales bacterium]|nr:hypothetical protein [Gemmatimonadales bacterium]